PGLPPSRPSCCEPRWPKRAWSTPSSFTRPSTGSRFPTTPPTTSRPAPGTGRPCGTCTWPIWSSGRRTAGQPETGSTRQRLYRPWCLRGSLAFPDRNPSEAVQLLVPGESAYSPGFSRVNMRIHPVAAASHRDGRGAAAGIDLGEQMVMWLRREGARCCRVARALRHARAADDRPNRQATGAVSLRYLSRLGSQPGGEAVLVGEGDGLGAVASVDLGEQVVDVALDRAFADDKALGDLGVGQAGRDEGQHLGFPGGESGWERRDRPARVGRRWPGPQGDRVDQVMLDGGVDDRVVVEDLPQSLADLRPARVLGQVSAGAGPQRAEHRPVVGVGGERDHLDLGNAFAQQAPRSSRRSGWSR